MNKNISLILSLLTLFSCQEMPKKEAEEAESKTLKGWETLSKKTASMDGIFSKMSQKLKVAGQLKMVFLHLMNQMQKEKVIKVF